MVLIETLKAARFRNCAEGVFRFSNDKVVFTGPNGSGKTNLLEALYFLSILRSFRTVSGRELIQLGERSFDLGCRLRKGTFREELRILQWADGRRETLIDGNRVRRSSEFIREFRAVVFVPEDRNIPGGSSSYRRRFFDMLIATREGDYLSALSNYNRALSQRNRALKQSEKPEIAAVFEPELARHAPLISSRRRLYAQWIEEEVNALLTAETGLEFRIRYKCDFPEDEADFLALLRKNREKERIRACTSIGPQLDEFEFLLDGRALRSYGSTGQIRMIALLLKLAEFNLFRRSGDGWLVVLADDVTGELDERNKELFLQTISHADQQFFTFTEFPTFLSGAQEMRVPEIIKK